MCSTSFRFHMSLTGKVADEVLREELRQALAASLRRETGGAPFGLDSLVLFVQPAPGEPFAIRERHVAARLLRMKKLGDEPLIDPTAQSAGPRRLAATPRSGRRTKLNESALGDYSYVVNDGDPCLHHGRQVLLDRRDGAHQSGQPSDAARLASPFHLSRFGLFRGRGGPRTPSSTGGAPFASRSATTSGSAMVAVLLPGRKVGDGAVVRGRRHRHQGRGALHHRRGQSGPADQEALHASDLGAPSPGSPGGIGAMRRCTAPWPDFRALPVEAFLEKYES